LPEAHVEAPTIGSIILASLLLKLGTFGFLRYNLPLFWYGANYFASIVDLCALLSVVYASLITIRQTDLKRIVAYSSIAHMNLILLGLLTLNKQGIDGAVYLMLGHGFVSSGLFLCVGILYDRYHTRLIQYYGGITIIAPFVALFCFIFTIANMGFPGTCNFIGEIGIFIGLFTHNIFLAISAGIGIVLSAIYSI
jgi:NADH-quinone oxidoreductase subunit M